MSRLKKALADEFAVKFNLKEATRYIEDGFEKDKTLPWRGALSNKLGTIQKDQRDAFKEAVQKRIVEAVKSIEEGGHHMRTVKRIRPHVRVNPR